MAHAPATRAPLLSERALRRMSVGQFLSESLGYGRGSLEARRTGAGIRFYLRHGKPQRRISLGSTSGPEALSLHEARERAIALSGEQAPSQVGGRTLGALLEAYTEQLARLDRPSAAPTAALFARHVHQAHPALWARDAASVTTDAVISLLEPLVEANKLATAAKLRAGLHAAFAAAGEARCNAQARNLRGFGITANPVGPVAPIRAGRMTRARVLSISELRAYWRRIGMLDGPAGALLRVHLATGCQRLAMLRRATRGDLAPDGLMLYDRKGRRDAPRAHLVPLTPPATTALHALGSGHWLFTLDGGRSPAGRSSVHRHVTAIAQAMIDAGEACEPFHVGDLRRSVETRLAAEGVMRDVRAHLLSHGLSGVQDRHYNRYDFHAEKLDALNVLWDLVRNDGGGRQQQSTRMRTPTRLERPAPASSASAGPHATVARAWTSGD